MDESTLTKNEFADLIQYFFEEYLPKHRGVSPHTIKNYRDTIKLFLTWLSATGKSTDTRILSTLHVQDILDFLNDLERKRLNSIATRNNRLAALKSFFFMCYLRKPEAKPALEILQFIPMKKMNRPLIDFFEHEDVLKVLASVNQSHPNGARDFLILNLLYDTGMRASELAGIQLNGFDSSRNTLEILGKGNKWRRIQIWPRTTQLLTEYIQHSRSIPKPLYQDYLIISRERAALTRSGVHKICHKYLEKSGIPRQIHSAKRSAVHSWRHTAAVQMIRQGRSLLEVCVRLGHSSVEVTQKYLNLDLSIKKERLNELVRFTEKFLPQKIASEKNPLKTTEEMLSFLKSL
jgi:integrase/recombinase XerD